MHEKKKGRFMNLTGIWNTNFFSWLFDFSSLCSLYAAKSNVDCVYLFIYSPLVLCSLWIGAIPLAHDLVSLLHIWWKPHGTTSQAFSWNIFYAHTHTYSICVYLDLTHFSNCFSEMVSWNRFWMYLLHRLCLGICLLGIWLCH